MRCTGRIVLAGVARWMSVSRPKRIPSPLGTNRDLCPVWSHALRQAERRANTGILREGSDILLIDAEHLGVVEPSGACKHAQ